MLVSSSMKPRNTLSFFYDTEQHNYLFVFDVYFYAITGLKLHILFTADLL